MRNSTIRAHVYVRDVGRSPVAPLLIAAMEGLARHGITPRLMPHDRPSPCDLAVVWGVRNHAAIASAQTTGGRTLVLERGYVGDRFHWTSAGFDGLNGRAEFRTEGKSPDRWQRHHAGVLRPWRGHAGEHVLIMGQVPGDAALAGVDIAAWYRSTAQALRSEGLPVAFRPHPQAPTARVEQAETSTGTLADALARAMWVVTYNSNSAVDAALAGVPVVASDPGSMAWPIAGRDPLSPPPTRDRTDWAARLAWCQWTPDEIAGGETWAHLAPGLTVRADEAHSRSEVPACSA